MRLALLVLLGVLTSVTTLSCVAWRIQEEGLLLTPRHVSPVKSARHGMQMDPRWAHDALGSSDETMRSAGCLVTVLASSMQYAGVDITAGSLNAKLSEGRAYTRHGALIWARFHRVFPSLRVEARQVFTARTLHHDLDGDRLPMVQIRRGLFWRPHWLLVVGADEAQFLVLDPARRSAGPVPLGSYGPVHAYRVLRASR